MVKPEIRYGLWGGLFLIIWYWIQYFAGFHNVRFVFAQYAGFVNYFMLFLLLRLSIREKRSDLLENFDVQAGLRSGLIQCMITAWIFAGWLMVYNYFVNKLWVENFVMWQSQSGYSLPFFSIKTSEDFSHVMMLSNTETHIVLNFLGILIFGSVCSVLVAASLKKHHKSNALS
jgi:hypothetical protein